MYCESCKVEFSEGLRYCKWCGQQLSGRSRVTSELHKCHVCGASVQPGWAYCKSCGVRLLATASQSEVICPHCGTAASSPAVECLSCGQDLTGVTETAAAGPSVEPANAYCPSCGQEIERGATFCKACGAITAGAASLTTPDLTLAAACPQCGNRNHPGLTHCRVCGTALAGPLEIPSGDLPNRPPVADQPSRQTLPDLPRQTAKERLDDSTDRRNSASVAHRELTAPRSEDEIHRQITTAVVPPTAETRAFSSVGWPDAKLAPPDASLVPPDATLAPPDATLAPPDIAVTTERETSYRLPTPQKASEGLGVLSGYDQRAASDAAPPSQTIGPARKPNAIVAIASVVIALIVIGAAGFLVWRYLVGTRAGAGRGAPAPSAQSETGTPRDAPATKVDPDRPAAAQPPASASATSAPEGMVLVEAGSYTIGRDNGDTYARPSRTVTLPSFYVDRTEVTNAEYKTFVDATGHKAPRGWQGGAFPAGHENWPVTEVTWQDAVDYATWAGKRLPTEAEWEAAARGPEGRVYPWGDSWRPGMANIKTKGITEVGRFKEGASPAGALDMIGNVWEWTADEFKLYPGSKASLPGGMKPGVTYRVIRGGAYDCNEKNDASYRGFVDANEPLDKTGFRCVKDINK